jgi:soluble lytic murein transglycosylase-like protein
VGAAVGPDAATFCISRNDAVKCNELNNFGGLVRVLRSGDAVMHRTQQFRIICDCQRHERPLWRRAVRAARTVGRQLRRRGVAIAVGLPIACFALGFPIEAMNNAIVKDSARLLFASTPLSDAFFPKRAAAPSIETMKEAFFNNEVPYGSIIYREARRNHLAPELVAAVVQAESDFRPRLVSRKSAQGLMQIIPETSRLLGCENPFDPAANIAAGCKYLRQLLDRFGDQSMAVAAYNAGEGNIERFGGIPPFDETRDYVQRVARHTEEYRQRIRNRFRVAARISAMVQ